VLSQQRGEAQLLPLACKWETAAVLTARSGRAEAQSKTEGSVVIHLLPGIFTEVVTWNLPGAKVGVLVSGRVGSRTIAVPLSAGVLSHGSAAQIFKYNETETEVTG